MRYSHQNANHNDGLADDLTLQRPPHQSVPYGGTTKTIEIMEQAASGPRGASSVELRYVIEDIVRGIRSRDRLSQLSAIYNWFMSRYKFLADPITAELVKDPVKLLEEMQEKGIALGDCDDASTWIVGATRAIGIPSKFMRVGFRQNHEDQLHGDNVYSHVLVVAPDQYGRQILLDPVAARRTVLMAERSKIHRLGV